MLVIISPDKAKPTRAEKFSLELFWLQIYKIYRGYYMAARKYEIFLRVLKNISQVSAVNE